MRTRASWAAPLLALCLLIMAAGYLLLRRQLAEQTAELEVLQRRVDAQHKQIWQDGLYIPWLEERLTAAHEHGTPAEWRAAVLEREAQRVKELSDKNRAAHAPPATGGPR